MILMTFSWFHYGFSRDLAAQTAARAVAAIAHKSESCVIATSWRLKKS